MEFLRVRDFYVNSQFNPPMCLKLHEELTIIFIFTVRCTNKEQRKREQTSSSSLLIHEQAVPRLFTPASEAWATFHHLSKKTSSEILFDLDQYRTHKSEQ